MDAERKALEDVLAFLDGRGELNGVWFGGVPPEGYTTGRFWWRSLLRERSAALLARIEALESWVAEALPVLREDRQCMIDSHCLLTPALEPRIETLDEDVRPWVESLEAKIALGERLLGIDLAARGGEVG